jgi:hypothetical protein
MGNYDKKFICDLLQDLGKIDIIDKKLINVVLSIFCQFDYIQVCKLEYIICNIFYVNLYIKD